MTMHVGFQVVNIIFAIVLLVSFVVGFVYLQRFLSKQKNKFIGLIFPILFFLTSILYCSSYSINYTDYSNGTSVYIDEYPVQNEEDQIIDEDFQITYGTTSNFETQQNSFTQENNENPFLAVIYIFAIFNIPTVFSLLIYRSCRKNMLKNQDIDKMKIQDL